MKLLLALPAVVVAMMLASCDLAPLHEQTRTQSVPFRPGMALRVQSENGAISVARSSRSDVEIIAKVRALSAERLQATSIVAEPQANGTLSIYATWPDRRRNREGCEFTISLPDANGVALHTSNGAISLRDLGGKATLETSNGSVKLENHRGDVEADSSNGAIQLRGVAGSVDAETSNGNIEIHGATGQVVAGSSNGEVEISLAGNARGPVRATSSNGAVVLDVGPAFAGGLSADTSNGSIRVDGLPSSRVVSRGKHSARLQFGSGDESTLTTSNGSITIRGPGVAERE